MVISRDRKKILLIKKPDPAVKGINWNFLVIFLSTIMVLIGIPSMVSACFSYSFMQDWGIVIFVICVSATVFLLGILYAYAASHRYKGLLSKYNKILIIIIIAGLLILSFLMVFTVSLAYFFIFIYLFFFFVLIGYFGIITPQMKQMFKKLCNLSLAGLMLMYLGGVLLSINMFKPLLSEIPFREFGFVFFLLGVLLFFINVSILVSKIENINKTL